MTIGVFPAMTQVQPQFAGKRQAPMYLAGALLGGFTMLAATNAVDAAVDLKQCETVQAKEAQDLKDNPRFQEIYDKLDIKKVDCKTEGTVLGIHGGLTALDLGLIAGITRMLRKTDAQGEQLEVTVTSGGPEPDPEPKDVSASENDRPDPESEELN